MASSDKKKKKKSKYSAKSKAKAAMANSSTKVSDGRVSKKKKGKKKGKKKKKSASTQPTRQSQRVAGPAFKPPADVATKPLEVELESQFWFKDNPGKPIFCPLTPVCPPSTITPSVYNGVYNSSLSLSLAQEPEEIRTSSPRCARRTSSATPASR